MSQEEPISLKPAPAGALSSSLVAPLSPLTYTGWDRLVNAHPQGSFFHGSAWARVLQDTYGHQPVYFGLVADGKLQGLLPVMELNSRLKGRRGVGLPFSDYCPILSSELVSAGELWNACLRYGRTRGWKFLECRGMTDEMAGAKASLTFYTHEIDLTKGEQALWTGFKSRVRTPIRRAQEAGVKIDFETDLVAVRTYYALHCETRRKHGLPPQPFSFFQNIQRHVLASNGGWVALARWQGRVVAAGVFLHMGRRAIHKFGASLPAFQHLSANHLLMWETIRRYCQSNVDALELGRTSLGNEGLRQFKLGFLPRESELRYCRFDYRANAFAVDQDRTEGWFNHVFRRLPMPLLRLAGRVLYPQMS